MSSKRTLILGINLLWTIIIFVLCVMPSDDLPNPRFNFPHIDKVVHFGMYFVSSLLMMYPLERYRHFSRAHIWCIAIGFAFLFGGAVELLQARYFGRSGDWYDLLADVLGGTAGCLAYPAVKRLLHKKRGE